MGVGYGLGTDLIPDEAVPAAARMHVNAEGFADQLAVPLDAIRAAQTTKPWGQCPAGEAFEESYLGSDGAGVEDILDSSEGIFEAVAGLATNAGIGALRTDLVDDSIGGQLEQLPAEGLAGVPLAEHPAVPGSAGGPPAVGAGSVSAPSPPPPLASPRVSWLADLPRYRTLTDADRARLALEQASAGGLPPEGPVGG